MVCFDPEPLPPEKPAKKRKRDRLPYTSITNAALDLGLPMSEIRRMPWGRLVMMLQARAQSYEEDDEPKEASFNQIASLFGAG